MLQAIRAVAMVLVLWPLVGHAQESVAGRTLQYKNSHGQTYWTTYKKDGTTFTKSTKTRGSGFMYDSGRWRMEQGVICERYTNWQGGKEFCHEPGVTGRPSASDERHSEDTCSNQNSECMAFCRTPAGRAQGKSCRQTCSSRMSVCLKTGMYAWRNKPNVVGLQRR